MKYSQNSEEQVIGELFAKAEIATGRLLEIGAYSPDTFSNTRALIDAGWAGVLVEPSPGPFLALLNHYHSNPNVDLVNAAIGNHSALTEFWDSGGDAISTTNLAHKTKWQEGYSVNYKKYYVWTLPFSAIFERYGHQFEFINIDVESTNWDLFSVLPFSQLTGTRVICIEHDGYDARMAELVRPYGFAVVHKNGENIILAR